MVLQAPNKLLDAQSSSRTTPSTPYELPSDPTMSETVQLPLHEPVALMCSAPCWEAALQPKLPTAGVAAAATAPLPAAVVPAAQQRQQHCINRGGMASLALVTTLGVDFFIWTLS